MLVAHLIEPFWSAENFVNFVKRTVLDILDKRREQIDKMSISDMSERYFCFRVITAKSTRDLETLRMKLEDMGEI